MIKKQKANVIIDGQWGSTGKGLLAGWLYHTYPALTVGVCDFMPNAGHTVILPNGRKWVSRHVPIAAAYGRTALIGPQASVDLTVLQEELVVLRSLLPTDVASPEICIHPLATIVVDEDRQAEQHHCSWIAGTQKGGHSANARKTLRSVDARLAGENVGRFEKLGVHVCDTQAVLQKALSLGGTALVETAQGFDLGLNHGTHYPHVTGRDCLVGRVLDNAGVPIRDVGSIIGCLRTFPIRVGNTAEGHSGPCYADQRELTWEQVSKDAGQEVKEMTTVTKRVRRVFTFSDAQLRRFLTFVRPDYLFLNFFNYWNGLEASEISARLWHIKAIAGEHGAHLQLLGSGPSNEDMVDLAVSDVGALCI